MRPQGVTRSVLCAALLSLPAWVVYADSAVILGGGHVASWFTAGYVANPNNSAFNLVAAPFPLAFGGPCPGPCPFSTITLAALGSSALEGAVVNVGGAGFFGTIYLTQEVQPASARTTGLTASAYSGDSPTGFPLVRPRLVDRSNPTRSVDIPVVLVSQLIVANLPVLNFAGAARDGQAHSNLVLGNVLRNDNQPGEDLAVTLELFDSDGNRVGSGSLALAYGQTALVGDIASYLGVTHLPLGLLRITRTNGRALMWGILYTIDSNGSVTASSGANLAP